MAAKPSTGSHKALQKIQDQVTCGICLEPYKQPRLLKCQHVFCEQCLQDLVRGGQSLPCPQCRQVTPLPVNGVPGLQDAFYIHSLFDIQDDLSSTSRCTTHPEKEADMYCEQCDQLICSHCLVSDHRDHQYDLVSKLFAKQEKVIVDSLKPVGEQIATLERAVESVNTRCAAVVEQKTAVVAEIHTAMADLRQALEVRETELVGKAEQTAQQKLKTLAAQRDGFELQLGQLRSCQDNVEKSRRTCSQGEILRMKSSLVKQVNDLTGSFKPQTLVLAEQADMRFTHRLPELVKTCQQFGEVYCHLVCPEKCRASEEKIRKIVTRGQKMDITVKTFDRKGKAYLRPVDSSLRCELASDGSSQVRGTVKRRNQNIYDISYQPQVTGEHQLHILIEEQPILNSPFTFTVLPNFTTPAKIIGDFNEPWGIAIREGGEMVVAECGGNRVSIITANGRKESSFGVSRPGWFTDFLSKFGFWGGKGKSRNMEKPSELHWPKGVAIDTKGKILVVDNCDHRIQQWSSTGKHLATVGEGGDEPLQFQSPVGIAVHPQTENVYVADCYNHRIHVLNFNRAKMNMSFGSRGSNNGQFYQPYDISTDRESNVYVADRLNHRIQVFTADGVYLRQFGKKGKREGELKNPVSIAIGPSNVVYVGEQGNHRVSIFSTDGEFIKSFGRKGRGPVEFNCPYGLAVDKKGTLHVSDHGNNRVQIFN